MTTTVAPRKTGASWQFIERRGRRTNAFGPREIKETFNMEVALRPTPAVFSDEVIVRALNMDCCIVLQDDSSSDGKPLTLQHLHRVRDNEDALGGKFLYDIGWYQSEPLFTTDTPRPGLFLKGRSVISGSTSKTFVGESLVAAEFVEKLFGDELPKQYRDAIEELRTRAGEIEAICKADWKDGVRRCVELTFSRLFRESPVEVLYRILLAQEVNRERLFETVYTRTNVLSSVCRFVSVGRAASDGADLNDWCPHDAHGYIGFSFSCSGELEPVG